MSRNNVASRDCEREPPCIKGINKREGIKPERKDEFRALKEARKLQRKIKDSRRRAENFPDGRSIKESTSSHELPGNVDHGARVLRQTKRSDLHAVVYRFVE